jgi:hypothetical protein
MRTPAGTICRYYYEDFHRGRQTQECRLVMANARSLPWAPELCAKCKVPEILRANGSPDLRLELTVRKRLGLFTRLDVDAYCLKHVCEIEDPYVGCPSCEAEIAAGNGPDPAGDDR